MIRMIACGTAGVALMFAACEAKDSCDPGQKRVQGGCVANASSGSGGSKSKGGAGGADASSASSETDAGPAKVDAGAVMADAAAASECSKNSGATLDDACDTNVDCNCAAPYCAKMPGTPKGMCTVFCDPAAMDCPSGHRCFDLSTLGVKGYTPFCIKG